MSQRIGRIEIDAAKLWRDHPPQLRHPKKIALLELAGGLDRTPHGTLVITRWAPGEAARVGSTVKVAGVDGPFAYPRVEAGIDAWHVNFADTHLFAFYGGPAFAQDEIQVAEHPILASVRVALESGRGADGGGPFPPLTFEDGPTPVLVRNVERWCAIDTDPELAQPYGIYGRCLARASDEALRQAVTRLDDAPPTNILAMVAPQGMGAYTRAQIEEIVTTAVTGFAAAKLESTAAAGSAAPPRVRIHTGHWGTGAFGGNRILMAAAQIVAAGIAGVDELLYHSLDDDGVQSFEKGRAVAEGMAEAMTLGEVVDGLLARRFFWGASDGN